MTAPTKDDLEFYVNMQVEVPHTLLGDLMVTAFDGQYGGVWRCGWATDVEYHIDKAEKAIDNVWKAVTITTNYDEDLDEWPSPTVKVDWAMLVKGMQLILADEKYDGSLRKRIAQAIMDDDAGELDANDADTIVQMAVFGKEVYG